MAGKNQVTLTFGSDTKGIDQAVKKVDRSTDAMGKSFDKLKLVGAAAGAAAGVALAAGIAAGLQSSKVDALLAAQLGASGEFAADLGRITGDLYGRGVVASMEDAADAVRAVWQQGLLAEDATSAEIERVAAKVANLSTVMQEDASRVSAAVTQMLRTGMAGSAEEAFDLLARAQQQGLNKSQDLLDTFNEYGTQFRKLGLDGPAALGLMSQALKAGARDSDTAADAIKEFSIRAIDGSKLSAEGYRALGLDAAKMTRVFAKGGPEAAAAFDVVLDKLRAIRDPAKQAQAAVALFGTKAEDLGASLFAMDLTGAADQMGNVAGAADRMGATLEQSAGARLDSFKRKAQAALVEQLAKAVPHIEATFGWLSRNSSWVVPLATGLGSLAAAIGVIVVATKIWTAVHAALGVVMALSPVGLIIVAVAALVALIVLIATKTTWFQDIWNAAWGGIKSAAQAVWGWMSGTLWPGIKGVFGGIASAIQNAFRGAFNFVARAWNNTVGRLSWTVPGWIPGLGGHTFAAPKLPTFHTGGIVSGAMGSETLAVLRAGERVTPSGGGGGGQAVTLRVVGNDRAIVELIKRLVKVEGGGSVQAAFGR
jgi:phage-related minor tail protein